MDPNAEASFFCKRCRADDAKRCRCPLPAVRSDHDWNADAAYNLWPERAKVSAAGPAGWDGRIAGLHEVAERSRT